MQTSQAALYASPILIVDDNEINRNVLEETLRSHGFSQLLSVSSAKEALAQMPDFCPDIILLDVIMPDMDGFEYCKLVRNDPHYGDLPILFQTVITQPELRYHAFQVGATDFISKPIYPDEVYARIMVHLQNRLYMKNLQEQKVRMENELEYARQLQTSILPSAKAIADIETIYGLDIASYFKPSSDIGGDFWGIQSVSLNKTALWMVDVSGHGVASAMNAFRLQAYLHEPSTRAHNPGEYLSSMNEKLMRLLQRGQFATMFYGVYDAHDHEIRYSCACHPNPILVRHEHDEYEILDGSGQPLGISIENYPTQTSHFYAGDILFLYSDAMTETPNQQGEFIDERTLAQMILSHKDETASAIQEKLLDLFVQHSGGKMIDDLTFCVIKRGLA